MLEARNLLQRLPMELRCCILASLSDLESLASATLTCRALYWAFKNNEGRVIRDVLINCVGLVALPEAIIAHRCCPPYLSTCIQLRMDIWGEEQIHRQNIYISDFLQRLERPSPILTTWAMRDARALGDFHLKVVSKLTHRFIQACAKASSSEFPLENSLCLYPVSESERERIERALYRFEIFRRLFSCFSDREEYLLPYAATFFSKFAPWENAQLICIHEFLAREIIPVFNDVAEHDITWGIHLTDFKAAIGRPVIQHLLTLGLERILEIASCALYKDRERLLAVGEAPPGENYTFFQSAITSIRELSSLEGIGHNILVAPPFCADEDASEEHTWELSLTHNPRSSLDAIYDELDWPYRQCGFILWDYERLQSLGILEPLRMSAQDLEFSSAALMDMQPSWDARAAIYQRGGRGYWAKDDESHIVWPEYSEEEKDARGARHWQTWN
ncbi:hypothetical protein K449DRAFT_418954 [Hypoxylon sp. EC38]|nr:hypothetical protein K449DRAFT_418954 [Hypoxylon sp. EC38]